MVASYDKLDNKCKEFQVLDIMIPPRYDVKNINSHIKLNSKIKHYLGKFANFHVLDPFNFLNINHISYYDGLHMNMKGKHTLCKKITAKILGLDTTYKNQYPPIQSSYKHYTKDTRQPYLFSHPQRKTFNPKSHQKRNYSHTNNAFIQNQRVSHQTHTVPNSNAPFYGITPYNK